ncbi:class F sortase [Ornithinimicrobium cerasi]|uniref:Sortase family protein n=1 Tax=Ornithinimicrobium cerasi TaxID=2248773 RepID=A0A285VU05_9MICO|nr:class F sortase [Ornithinimicrobium cerasi]SOC57492.1 Sortase family protein [Ornithinimicrobium cerasi]SOC57539.1 Sortase family protein [Ornithinimicrobium cerasi]
MTDTRPRGDRTGTGAVPPLLLVAAGLVLAVVAGLALLLQLRGDVDVAAPTTTSPAAMSVPAATTAPADQAAPTTGEADPTTVEPTEAAPPPTTPVPTPSAQEQGQGQVAPSWITIAAGGVDGALQPQGLAADGTINPGRQEIIWFTGGDRVQPGQVGTSVIAAHVTWEGQADAFVNLPSVSAGDVVTVGYTDGSSSSFTVTSTAAVDKDQLARSLSVWGPHPDRPRLAIITCDPALGYQSDGHTEANFVVIAEA